MDLQTQTTAEAELLAVVRAARALLEDVDAADKVKRGDFYHARRDLRTALAELDKRNV